MYFLAHAKNGEVVAIGQTLQSKPTWCYPASNVKQYISSFKKGDEIEAKVSKDAAGKMILAFIKKVGGGASNGNRTFVPRTTAKETGSLDNRWKSSGGLTEKDESIIKQTALKAAVEAVKVLEGQLPDAQAVVVAVKDIFTGILPLVTSLEVDNAKGVGQVDDPIPSNGGLEEVVIN